MGPTRPRGLLHLHPPGFKAIIEGWSPEFSSQGHDCGIHICSMRHPESCQFEKLNVLTDQPGTSEATNAPGFGKGPIPHRVVAQSSEVVASAVLRPSTMEKISRQPPSWLQMTTCYCVSYIQMVQQEHVVESI